MSIDFFTIKPELSYSIREAARYLGIHRCTIYEYIKHLSKPLPFFRERPNSSIRFKGFDLILYKKAGLPKRGRKFKNGHSPSTRTSN